MNIALKKTPVLVSVSLFALFVMTWACPVRAADPALLNELESSSSSALIFGSGTNTTFGAGAGYSRIVTDMFQASAVAGFNITSYPVGGMTSLTLKVGPTYNYSCDNTGVRNAFYLRALAGLAFGTNSTSGTSNSSVNFAYTVQAGKRFEIVPSLFWKPAIDMSGTTASNTNPVFSIIPAQFAFMF
jgi:hypothetical protein